MNLDARVCTRSAEFRAEESDGRTLEGYAAVTGQNTVISSWEGRFNEVIAPGAFKKTLREKSVVQMQYNHGYDVRIGTVPIGAYDELREDEQGLFVSGRLFDNDVVEPVRQAIEAGAISGMSFKFAVIRDEWRDSKGKLIKDQSKLYNLLYSASEDDSEMPTRTIKEVRLYEAGPVSTPAYSGTSVGVRSAQDLSESERMAVAARHLKLSEPDEGDEDRTAQITQWLRAEADWKADVAVWLREEALYNDECRAWLEAEAAHKISDAATRSTSEKKADAAPAGTSVRTQQDSPTRKVTKMNLEQLRTRRAAIVARFSAIETEHRDADLPDDVQTEFETLTDEMREIDAKVAKIEERQAFMKGIAAQGGSQVERTAPPAAKSPAFHQKADDLFNLDELRMAATSPEDFVSRATDNARKAIEGAHFSRVVSNEKAQARATELLETYDDEDGTLAKRILTTGSPLYERAFGKALKACSTAGLTIEEQRAMSLGTDSAGGFAVPFQLDPSVILTNDGFIGDIRSVARVETIVGKEWQGITSDGISVSRDASPAPGELARFAEAAEAPDNSFALAQPKIRVSRVQGFVPFSIEIEQDWGGLRSEITRMLADAKAREENCSFTLGTATDGISLYPQGVITGSTNTLTLATGLTTAATIKAAGSGFLFALEEALVPRYRGNAKFMANKNFYNLVRQLDTAGGANLWEYIGKGLPNQLLGYDVVENSDMALVPTAAAATKIAAFGDFSQYLIVDRIGMTVELVPHLMGANGRPTGQRGVYAVWRNNAMILVQKAIKTLVTAAS
jgi:HK97 family phage major capsid protein/HK97 family phage prohead protease